ncbi:MAG: MFS transporter [Mycobacteriales bacterium]
MERWLINREFARLWYGQAVSSIGDFVFTTTLVLWVATVIARGKPWAPAAASGVLVAAGAGVLLVGPAAGVFVDRWDRRRTMLGTEVLRGLAVGALAVLSLRPVRSLPIEVWLAVIYLVVFVVNAADQFFSPCRLAVLGAIVPGDADRARAAGLGQATSATATIIGPPLAAPLLFAAGVEWALLINAVSYAFSFVAIRGIHISGADPPPSPSGRPGLRKEFAAGLRFFSHSRLLVSLLVIAVVAQSGTGALNSLDVFFVTENLHVSAHLYGLLSMAFGIGAVAGSLAAGLVVRRVGARRTIWVGLLVTGLLVLCYARQGQFAAGLAITAALSVPVALLNTGITPLLLKATPPELLGRVAAVFNPINQLASLLSAGVAGWLASTALLHFHTSVAGLHVGRIDTLFSAAGILIVLAAGFAFVTLPLEVEEATSPPGAAGMILPGPPGGLAKRRERTR